METLTVQEIIAVSGGDAGNGSIVILPGDGYFVNSSSTYDLSGYGIPGPGDYGQIQAMKASLAQYLANNPGSNSSDFYKY